MNGYIDPSGRVPSASIDEGASDLGAGDVETCIASAVRRWTFPRAPGPTIVRYPFLLGRTE